MARPRVLLTGFGPFPGAAENSSAWLVEELAGDRQLSHLGCDLHAEVLPTEWAEVSRLGPGLSSAPSAAPDPASRPAQARARVPDRALGAQSDRPQGGCARRRSRQAHRSLIAPTAASIRQFRLRNSPGICGREAFRRCLPLGGNLSLQLSLLSLASLGARAERGVRRLFCASPAWAQPRRPLERG